MKSIWRFLPVEGSEMTLPSCSTLISIAFPAKEIFVEGSPSNILKLRDDDDHASLTNKRKRRWPRNFLNQIHHPRTLPIVVDNPYCDKRRHDQRKG